MRKTAPVEQVNLTPMIDIVFQMIIFFLFTLNLDQEKFTEQMKLADAKDGKAVEKVHPGTIFIEVTAKGRIYMSRTQLSQKQLRDILTTTRNRFGQHSPVVVYAHGKVEHRHLKVVMEIVSGTGFYNTSFAALKADE